MAMREEGRRGSGDIAFVEKMMLVSSALLSMMGKLFSTAITHHRGVP
jgi:hypothetical protein